MDTLKVECVDCKNRYTVEYCEGAIWPPEACGVCGSVRIVVSHDSKEEEESPVIPAMPKIEGALSPSAIFSRAMQRNKHAIAELREVSNLVNIGYGAQSSQAARLINAAKESLFVVGELLAHRRDRHREREAKPQASVSFLVTEGEAGNSEDSER